MAFQEVPSRVNVDELERGVLQRWEEEKVFEQALKQTEKGDLYTFYDGPPYATGKPHYGHILQSAIKDTVLRYKTMQGYFVPRRVGWDCHGLPVETIVEKELGFKTKKDIEEYGIEKFNARCRETVTRYVDDFTATLKRIGRWADYEKPYFTMERTYMESEWWVFKQLWEQGLIYQAFRSTPYCIRCETPLSNFEVSINYQDTTDTAVYVKLPVTDLHMSNDPDGQKLLQGKQLYLLVWTTTPWTLSGNVAVAYNPELSYVIAELNGGLYLLAKDRVKPVLGEGATIAKAWRPGDFRGVAYEPPYSKTAHALGIDARRFGLVEGEHVTADEGTGLVHMAPAFGEEDAEVGKRNDLPVLRTVTADGHFVAEVPQFAGQNIFAANKDITADLEKLGLLFKHEQYTHSYPFCWRCETPLIYYALDTWFVRVAELKQQMLEINTKQIEWTPKHVKAGRFGKGVESAPDWAVSRNRFWSVPLPLWECDRCDERVVVGDLAELKELAHVDDVPDMHRPYVDVLSWPCSAKAAQGKKCTGTMRRVPEVLDVWFDAGSMPYAQWHYPFANKKEMEAQFPADFIVEAIEQTRLWFYVLHVLAVALTRRDIGLGQSKPAFKQAIGAGIIFDEDGRKLSKKLKNYPEIDPTVKKYGADVLRLYLLSGATLGEPYRFSEEDLVQMQRQVYMTFWNVYSFFVRYANVHDWKAKNVKRKKQSMLDDWILARTKQLENDVVDAMNKYEVDRAARAFVPFIDDLSNWYVRRSRDRFQHGATEAEREAAFATLHEVLIRTSKLLAPFMPFVTEAMYQNLTGGESVHLEQLSEPQGLSQDEEKLLKDMAVIREIVSLSLAMRAKKGIKVRQPLGTVFIKEGETSKNIPGELWDIAIDELNMKEYEFIQEIPSGLPGLVTVSGATTSAFSVIPTPELEREGLAREIIRRGQVLRREAGFELNDRITLVSATGSVQLNSALDEHRELISAALQADEIIAKAEKEDASAELTIAGQKIHLGVIKKASNL